MNKQSIAPEQRQSWKSIAMVWVGSMICVPCLMIGGVLASRGLSLREMMISIVIGEKAIGEHEYARLFTAMKQYLGKEVFAFMPIEAGGVNSMLPIAAAARLGLPMVDVDGMGRAFTLCSS